MKRVWISLLGLIVTVPAVAGSIVRTIDEILQEYFKIHEALAADTTQGVDSAARRIQRVASAADPVR